MAVAGFGDALDDLREEGIREMKLALPGMQGHFPPLVRAAVARRLRAAARGRVMGSWVTCRTRARAARLDAGVVVGDAGDSGRGTAASSAISSDGREGRIHLRILLS